MEVHNLLEDIVLSMVKDTYLDAEKVGSVACTCYQCQLDVACFVLNRIQPAYVLSGRGMIHHESDYKDYLQRKADVAALISRGMKRIRDTKRPHFSHTNEEETPPPSGDFFNFPTIIGRVFSSTTFEPLTGVTVQLLANGELVSMIGPSWQNPYITSLTTPGTYAFQPKPLMAGGMENNRVFELELVLHKDGFEEFHHFFSIGLVAENRYVESLSQKNTHKIGDQYIFPVAADSP